MEPTPLPPATTVTAKQVAERLGISDSTVYELWDSGQMRSVRIGKKIRRTAWEWVREYLDAGQPPAAPTA